uniref:Uncharacterized protein n=1 Tax=Panagrolaimus sp. ES5 TaxID=591445 RepID=A0AC34F3X3_9BILA
MKSLIIIVLFCCCCIELSHQRYLSRKDDATAVVVENGHVIAKRDLGDDFFNTLIEKGKSLFSDDDENNSDNDKPASVSSVNHDSNDKLADNRDRTSDSTSNSDNSHSHVASTKSEDDDSLIDEKTFKTILQKVISYASSSDSDNQNQDDTTHNTESGKTSDGNDSDDLSEKLGNILIREGIKIGIAELASSFLGKK